MKPKNAVIITQLIFSLFFTVLISNSWDFYFWPKFSIVTPKNYQTLSKNLFKENGKFIWIDQQSRRYELVTYAKEYKKNLQLLEDHFKHKKPLNFDICIIGSKKYFFNINIGDKLLFSENDVIEKINTEKESTLHIIIFSGILSLISCWVIFETKKWINQDKPSPKIVSN